MLMRLSRNRRWLLYPSLLAWWLWSSMALCNVQSVPAQPAHHSGMAMPDHTESTASHAESSAAVASHDCCEDAERDSCCGPAEVLQTKSSLDIAPQFFAAVLAWSMVVTEPISATFATVDTVASHAVFPRLHLLLSVFLD